MLFLLVKTPWFYFPLLFGAKCLMIRLMKGKLGILILVIGLSGCSSYHVPLFSSFGTSDIVVKKGDTLYSLSKRHNVPLGDLITTNRLSPPYTLSIGQKLKRPETGAFYTVRKGDTLYSIARAHGQTVTEVAKTNHIKAPYTLSVGQKLQVAKSLSGPIKTPAYQKTTSHQKGMKKTPPKTTTAKKTTKTVYKTPVKAPKKIFSWPVKGAILSDFGPKTGGGHNDGINIAAPKGTVVKAAESGTVAYADNQLKGYGNLILLHHNDGWITAYAHLDTMTVKKGQKVKKGQSIGTVGSTGTIKKPQLHFETRYKTKVVNPKTHLP